LSIDNWGIGFADEFKYNYKEVRLLKGFFKIRAQRALLNYSLFTIHYSL